ncbi:response regulator [Candidatus Bathyarchaeota archaeon]|nr:response regulator [Candidatus Bathyarchaeota archaeon]MBL7167984.1 response regulator [Candidatus Bathyarchaeota archaeon]
MSGGFDPGARIRVLHVDDDPSHQTMLRIFGETYDPRTEIEATDRIDDVFDHIERGDIDCILSDYRMPVCNGVELAHRVRAISDLPFILYTGQGSEEVAEAAFAAGVDDYIRKEAVPSHYQVLFRRIRSVVEKHWAEAQLRESLLTSASIVEAIPSGLLIYQFKEPDRLILVDGNPAAVRLAELDIDVWRGKDFSEIWPYDEEVGLKRRYIEIIKTGETMFFDKIFWKDERVEGYFSIRSFRIPGDRLAVTFDNISERVRYEERLLALHRHATGLDDLSSEEEVREWTMDVLESLGFEYISYLENTGVHLISRSSRGVNSLKRPIPLDGKGITVKVVNERRSILIKDLTDNSDYIQGTIPALSELAVPVALDDDIIAVINVESQVSDAFNEHDQRVLETLAMHVSSATKKLRGEFPVEMDPGKTVPATQ